ncbi:MAG: hypothetical protein LBQ06_00390, partial [Frankiaceae bacterium]|nr:hypothetical protein [Frankiaceae bacterium]
GGAAAAGPHAAVAGPGIDALPASRSPHPIEQLGMGPAPPAGESARRRDLSGAEIRRLRALRALYAHGAHNGEEPPKRLAELVAQLWTQGTGLADLAWALDMTPDAVVALLRMSGISPS